MKQYIDKKLGDIWVAHIAKLKYLNLALWLMFFDFIEFPLSSKKTF